MEKICLNVTLLSLLSFCYVMTENFNITGLDGRPGVYDSTKKTATLSKDGYDTFYSDVVEYSQAVTPPNIANPQLRPFATMPNPRFKSGIVGRIGGQTKFITLWGKLQESTDVVAEPIVESKKVKKSKQEIFKISGSEGQYDRATKTAYLEDAMGKKTEYVHVVEYSQLVTPPNIENPQLQLFAKMPNPKYKEINDDIVGGPTRYILLFCIKKNSASDHFVDEYEAGPVINDIAY